METLKRAVASIRTWSLQEGRQCLFAGSDSLRQAYGQGSGLHAALLRSEGGGGVKLENIWIKKAQINSVDWQHTRVDNNKTNKAQDSRFCSTASHHLCNIYETNKNPESTLLAKHWGMNTKKWR